MKLAICRLLQLCFALALIAMSRNTLAALPADPDLNGDGSPDLIWQNTNTGDVTVWYMAGTTWPGSWDYLARNIDTNWKIVGTADLNRDGKSDLIWQNTQTGDVTFWLMNGITPVDNGYIAHNIPLNWKVVGAVEASGDSNVDLLWQDTQSGDVLVWYMSGTQWTGTYDYIAQGISTQWRIAGTGNLSSRFTRQPVYQIIWQNTATGDVSYWTMNGATRMASDYLARNVPLAWKLVAITDISGDSQSDLIWYNTVTGDVSYWYNVSLSTGSYNSAYIARSIPAQWSIAPTH